MSNYSSNPNQRNITIHRDMPSKEKKDKGKFLSVYCNKITTAAQVLSEVPFKLYIYLLCNDDKFDLWFSPAVFAKEYGVGVSTARRAFNTLMEEGFIIEFGKNQYAFYEEPQLKATLVNTVKDEQRWLRDDEAEGGYVKRTYRAFYNEAKAAGWLEYEIDTTWKEAKIVEEE